ncbi:acylphosphatase [Oceanimonas baumannii]|uniref:Acylphosphatase n=1 Tax=Oceanimonas baumannii TaxID=129578 RepID=A0A235CHM4_9GAMM|nr:acylphosphatase [Oceanimonas baumannii]MCC4265737.1 acylphosphatase [Oceanimonas baumannii]OYD23956.1 acylphosphatase [Oceanimonas baumannii]TDW58710.1 acylphosphatase [Oceanimonas baumannii]
MSMIARKIWVSGRVQGVSFRYYTQCEAERLGVSGYARNLPDGRVEVLAEGPAAAVRQLTAWLRSGPDSAQVTGLEESDITPAGAKGFETG